MSVIEIAFEFPSMMKLPLMNSNYTIRQRQRPSLHNNNYWPPGADPIIYPKISSSYCYNTRRCCCHRSRRHYRSCHSSARPRRATHAGRVCRRRHCCNFLHQDERSPSWRGPIYRDRCADNPRDLRGPNDVSLDRAPTRGVSFGSPRLDFLMRQQTRHRYLPLCVDYE